jgi:hypothetical protein
VRTQHRLEKDYIIAARHTYLRIMKGNRILSSFNAIRL